MEQETLFENYYFLIYVYTWRKVDVKTMRVLVLPTRWGTKVPHSLAVNIPVCLCASDGGY